MVLPREWTFLDTEAAKLNHKVAFPNSYWDSICSPVSESVSI